MAKIKVQNHLVQLANLQKRKDEEYGESWKDFGAVFASFFPDGLTIKGEKDFGRYAILNMIIGKVHRYTQNFNNGGHVDSLDDIAVYSVMLQALDAENGVTEDE